MNRPCLFFMRSSLVDDAREKGNGFSLIFLYGIGLLAGQKGTPPSLFPS